MARNDMTRILRHKHRYRSNGTYKAGVKKNSGLTEDILLFGGIGLAVILFIKNKKPNSTNTTNNP
jgi:hypothetical protein